MIQPFTSPTTSSHSQGELTRFPSDLAVPCIPLNVKGWPEMKVVIMPLNKIHPKRLGDPAYGTGGKESKGDGWSFEAVSLFYQS